jgi:Spy/CpxP family protein refolding chaperone
MFKTNFFKLFFILIAVITIPLISLAQPNPNNIPPGDMQEPFEPDDNMKDTIHTVMLIEMTKFVGLSDKQALEISPKLDEIANLNQELKKNLKENVEKLKVLIESKGKDKEIKDLLEKMKNEEKEFRNKEFELREKLLVGLTTLQQAKMVLFHIQFREKMMEIMRNARMMERHRGPKDDKGNFGGTHSPQPPQNEEDSLQ